MPICSRKRFTVPAAWQGTHVELYVEGALSVSSWWLNGAPLLPLHTSGYTSVVLRLDNAGLAIGGDNTLVAFVDGTETTGWWYEGAGLTRHVTLTSSSAAARVATHSLAAPAAPAGAIHARATPAEGLFSDSASVTPFLVLENAGSAPVAAVVACALVEAAGAATTVSVTVPAGGEAPAACPPLAPASAELWSLPRPFLYTLAITVSVGGAVVDAMNASVGVRAVAWDSDHGLLVNGQRVKMRGYCNHESWGGVGAAVPDRVDLLRVQQVRGMGGNAWRT
jgi:beta-galactosidase